MHADSHIPKMSGVTSVGLNGVLWGVVRLARHHPQINITPFMRLPSAHQSLPGLMEGFVVLKFEKGLDRDIRWFLVRELHLKGAESNVVLKAVISESKT